MSTNLVGLAGDMASFYNLDHETTFNKIRSGISGQVKPLRELGIDMSAATLQAFALSQGITKEYKEMTQAFQAADGQLASTIQSEITRAQGVESTLSSSISQNAQDITLKVSKGDVSSEISAESDIISISSNRISISSTNFKLNRNGTITCQNANISGTIKTGGTYGYVELSYGRILGGLNSSTESGYISFNHRYDGNPGPRIAGNNGIAICTPHLGIGDYVGPGSNVTVNAGQTASQTFVTNIENNSGGGITWYTKTITFKNGLMVTTLT